MTTRWPRPKHSSHSQLHQFVLTALFSPMLPQVLPMVRLKYALLLYPALAHGFYTANKKSLTANQLLLSSDNNNYLEPWRGFYKAADKDFFTVRRSLPQPENVDFLNVALLNASVAKKRQTWWWPLLFLEQSIGTNLTRWTHPQTQRVFRLLFDD